MRWQFSFIGNVLHYIRICHSIKKISSFLIAFLFNDITHTRSTGVKLKFITHVLIASEFVIEKSIKFDDKRGHICKSCACNLKRSAKKLICYSECTPFLKSAYQYTMYVCRRKNIFYYVCLFNFPGINIRRYMPMKYTGENDEEMLSRIICEI